MPYEVLFGAAPDMSILRPFGCMAFAVNISPHRGKFDPRGNKCVFLGYDPTYKGYLLYELDSHKVYTSRDVKCFPDTYHFSHPTEKVSDIQLPLVPVSGNDGFDHDSSTDGLGESGHSSLEETEERVEPSRNIKTFQPLRSHRQHNPPAWMKDYVGTITTGTFFPTSRSTTPPTFPYSISPNFSPSYVSYLFNVSTLYEPTTYKEACVSTLR